MLASSACPDLATALKEGDELGRTDSALLRLLDVQFRLMGRDIEHPDGNLLVRREIAGVVAQEKAPDVFDPPRRHRTACPPRTVARACDWLASYEDAVVSTTGIGHRTPRPGSKPRLAPPEPWSLSAAWQELGATIRSTGAVRVAVR